MPDGSATAHLYRPKLISMLSEGYSLAALRKDAVAAATVAIVALPLSMAIAVASGVPPEWGLYTSVVGGFFVSALGGSRYQIGGPAGAFIVLVAATVAKFGIEGLLLAVLLSGLMLTLIGLSRLGALIRYIPHAVAIGFTCGIAVTILASQLKGLCGLKLTGAEPGPFFPKLAVLGAAWPSLSGRLDRRRRIGRADIRVAMVAAELVRHADRGCCRLNRDAAVQIADRHHRQPFRRNPAWAAGVAAACVYVVAFYRDFAVSLLVHAAGRH
jgi:MFS superfamily sulfate permease-like transporter